MWSASSARVFALALFLSGPVPALGAGGIAVVHMAPRGDDASDGSSAALAVQTLARAQAVLAALNPAPRQAEVRIAEGTYPRQAVVWSWIPPGTTIRIGSASPDRRPVFDGVGNDLTWFELRGGRGAPTRITIEGLKIVNYLSAIWFHGDRERLAERWTGENRIVGNVFEEIGARSADRTSNFAVEFVNSRDNVISGNAFRSIVSTARCGNLHSIYLAHGATGNRIEGNVFDGGCGATISVRDASHRNVIRGNRFLRQTGNALVLEWYCDSRQSSACTKRTPECPSWETEFSGNTVERAGGSTVPVLVYHDARAGECERPARGGVRVVSDMVVLQR